MAGEEDVSVVWISVERRLVRRAGLQVVGSDEPHVVARSPCGSSARAVLAATRASIVIAETMLIRSAKHGCFIEVSSRLDPLPRRRDVGAKLIKVGVEE